MTSSRSVTIRPLQADDRSAWDELWQAYLDFYQTPLPPDMSDLTWSRLHDSSEPMSGLVALINGRVRGITHYVMHRSTWARERYCYLEDLYVDADARGHGAGEALIEAVADAARAANADRLYWTTHEANAAARRLYDKVAMRTGFVQYRKAL
mgnify:CR=1 FL=1